MWQNSTVQIEGIAVLRGVAAPSVAAGGFLLFEMVQKLAATSTRLRPTGTPIRPALRDEFLYVGSVLHMHPPEPRQRCREDVL